METRKSANIYDIAAAAGVSIATVSRVMSNSEAVSVATRQKVLAAVDALGYVPNAFARGLGLGSMRHIGILCTDVSDSFYARAVSNLEHSLRESGFTSLLYCTGSLPEEKRKGLDIVLSKKVDAVVLAGSSFIEDGDNSHILAAARQTPIFCINALLDGPNIYCATCDEQRAMRENAAALYRAGCCRILYLYDALTYSGQQKLYGLEAARDELHAGRDSFLCVRVERDLGAVQACVNRLLDKGDPFDGVLASEDILAIGASKALMAKGITLPTIGYNNSILAQCATPALTSMDSMLDAICESTCVALKQLLSGGYPPQQVTFTGRLVERETFRTAEGPS